MATLFFYLICVDWNLERRRREVRRDEEQGTRFFLVPLITRLYCQIRHTDVPRHTLGNTNESYVNGDQQLRTAVGICRIYRRNLSSIFTRIEKVSPDRGEKLSKK